MIRLLAVVCLLGLLATNSVRAGEQQLSGHTFPLPDSNNLLL